MVYGVVNKTSIDDNSESCTSISITLGFKYRK